MSARTRVAGALALVTAAAGSASGCAPAPTAAVVHEHRLEPGHLVEAADASIDTFPETTTTLPEASTSTTVARAATETPVPLQVPADEPTAVAPRSPATGRCGGSLPSCAVMARESGGDPAAVNATGCGGSGCFGKWQFDPGTWGGYRGYATADQAPESVQDERARQVYAGGAGCAHWAAC